MPRQRNHPHHHAAAERAQRRAVEAGGPQIPHTNFIYSRDPWDPRRFAPGWVRRTPWEVIHLRSPRARAIAMLGVVLLLIGAILALVVLAHLP